VILKLVDHGDGTGPRVIDQDTGECVEKVRSIAYAASVHESSLLTITVIDPQIDIISEGTIEEETDDNPSGIQDRSRSASSDR